MKEMTYDGTNQDSGFVVQGFGLDGLFDLERFTIRNPKGSEFGVRLQSSGLQFGMIWRLYLERLAESHFIPKDATDAHTVLLEHPPAVKDREKQAAHHPRHKFCAVGRTKLT